VVQEVDQELPLGTPRRLSGWSAVPCRPYAVTLRSQLGIGWHFVTC